MRKVPDITHRFAPTPRRARRLVRRAFTAIGLTVALLALDVASGLAWDHVAAPGHTGPVTQVNDAIGAGHAAVHDDRADTPAMAKIPWRNEYFTELREITYEYWPFLLNRPHTFHGKYFTLDGWERRTWSSPDDVGAMPIVWFLGGSALWGEGQRDLSTIPSIVARLAHDDGLPIRAVNYGQSGWVLHQEQILLGELLDDERNPTPDVVAFYDGANDVSVQAELPSTLQADPLSPAPSHFGVDRALALLSGEWAAPAKATPDRDVRSDLLAAYRRHSMVLRAGRAIRRTISGDPAAADANTDDAAASVAAAERAASVYVEDRAEAQDLVTDAGASAFFFWQPEGLQVPGYRDAARTVGTPTVDLTDALAGREDSVFMDLVHTNEAGARIVAAAVYKTIRPRLEAWYRAHG